MRILSIDGGGVRGIASLVFLSELDRWLKLRYSKSIQDCFDIFVGTSTGALISVALVYLDMSPEQILATFYSRDRMLAIMPSLSWYSFMRYYFTPMYDGVEKRKLIEQYLPEGPMNGLFDAKHIRKKVLLTTYNIQQRAPKIYDSSVAGESLREIVDAATSPPVYFPSVLVGGQYEADGGLFANSPAIIGATEGLVTCPTAFQILSVGTGRSNTGNYSANFSGGLFGWLRNNLVDILLGAPQSFHNELLQLIMGDRFLRVNSALKSDSFEVSYTLDDTSEHNIDQLTRMGRYWFDLYRPKLEAFFDRELLGAKTEMVKFGPFASPRPAPSAPSIYPSAFTFTLE